MKENYFVCTLILACPITMTGATIRIEIESVVEQSIVTLGESPPVGTSLSAWFEYEVPRLVDNSGDPLFFEYQEIPSQGRVELLGRIYPLSGLSVFVSREPLDDFGWYVGFNAEMPVDQVDEQYNRLALNFSSESPFVDDGSRLPSTLMTWNLPSANPMIIFSHEGLDENMNSQVWTVRSSSLSKISMSEVPEPSSILMLPLAVIGLIRRHRICR